MGTLNRNAAPRGRPATNPGDCCPKCSFTRQNSCSAISAGRSRLALESPLRLGALAPRTLDRAPECNCSESHKSFRPMLWVNCAYTRLTTWHQGLKVRDLS